MSTAKVFVGSLPPGCKPEELRHLFTNYGVVVECDIMNRCGFVHMESSEMANTAIAALNGTEFKGQPIVVEPGRPKDRKGPGGAGGNRGPPGGGSNMNRRPMQGHGGNANTEPSGGPIGGGSNFSRGSGHMGNNNYRGGGAGAGGNRGSNFSNGNSFGPIRNESNNRQQRNAPYSKGPAQQSTDGPPQGFKSKFSQGRAGGGGGIDGKFGGGGAGGAGNFNNSSGSGRFGGNMNNQFQNWDNNNGGGGHSGNNTTAPLGGRRNFKNSPSSGFGGNSNNNDFHAGSSGGGGLGMGNQWGGSPSNNVGQDRRGFALPAVDHQQQQQQLPYGSPQGGRFGNGPSSLLASGNNADNGLFQRNRNNPSMNSGSLQGGRGGFNANRGGGFSGRGGAGGGGGSFSARRGGGGTPNNDRMSQNQNQGGGFNNRIPANGNNQNGQNAYQSEFPPLGSQGGGPGNRNRNNGPRPNMPGNRRY